MFHVSPFPKYCHRCFNPIQNIFIAGKINYKSPLLYESLSEVCFQYTFMYIMNSAILLRPECRQAVSSDDFLKQASSCFLPSTVQPVCVQSCLTLCDPVDYSPPGSSVHGISQARIPEQVAISFSGSSRSRN